MENITGNIKNKKSNKALHFIAIIAVVSCAIALMMGAYDPAKWIAVNNSVKAAQGYYENPELITESYAGLSELNLEMNGGTVEIVSGSVTEPQLDYYMEYENQYTVTFASGILKITRNTFKNKILGLPFVLAVWVQDKPVIVTVPTGASMTGANVQVGSGSLKAENINFSGDAVFQAKSGSVKVKSLNAANISIESGSGSARLEKSTAMQDITISTSSGSARAEECNAGNDLTVSAHSGSAKAEDCMAGNDLKIGAKSGSAVAEDCDAGSNLTVTSESGSSSVDECKAGGRLTVSAHSGSASIEDSTAEEISASAKSGSVKLENSIADKISCETISGSVYITLELGLATDYKYDLESKHGSVRINGEKFSDKYKTSSGTPGEKLIYVRAGSGSIRITNK